MFLKNFSCSFDTRSAARGYTLVETTMALVLLSVVIAGLITGYKLYMKTDQTTRQIRTDIEVQAALSRFLAMQGRLPCPADASLARNDAQYGFENCTTPIPLASGSGVVNPSGGCNQSAGGLCNTNAAATNIRRGMLPFITLEIPENRVYDVYRMRLTYMVTMNQTDSSSFVKGNGRISIRDISTIGGAEQSLTNPPDRADFAVFSSGANRVGAFPKNGAVTTTGDGRTRMTSVPAPCTQTNTGGKGEYTNCSLTSEIVYTGEPGRNFVSHTGAPTDWDVSVFLDDNVVYSSFNTVGQWRLTKDNQDDASLRDDLGKVSLKSTNISKLDLGLIASNPESAVRSNNKIIAGQVCDSNGNCFDPANISGNPDATPNPGGLTCAGKPMSGIKGDNNTGPSTKLVPECANAAGTFCSGTDLLKGFDSKGKPICTNATMTKCEAMAVTLCNGNNDEIISQTINKNLIGKNAWIPSGIVGINPAQPIQAGKQGDVMPLSLNTVSLFDTSDTCKNLFNSTKISADHYNKNNTRLGGISEAFQDPLDPKKNSYLLCGFGFNGNKKTYTYTCDGGTWTLTGESGSCAEGCILKAYDEKEHFCNTKSWTYNTDSSAVRLAGSIAVSDARKTFETKTRWEGSKTIPAGKSCGGIAPTALLDTKVCDCDDDLPPLTQTQKITCSDGDMIDTNNVVEADRIDDYTFIQRTSFTCDPSEKFGTWAQWSPEKINACKCNENAVKDTAYTCEDGTITDALPSPAYGATKPVWRQNRDCAATPTSWKTAKAAGTCKCVPELSKEDTTKSYKIACTSSDAFKSGWTGMPDTYGDVYVKATYDVTCTGDILTSTNITLAEQAFYPSGVKLPVKSTLKYTHDSGKNCLPLQGKWTKNSAIKEVTITSSSPALGGACVSNADILNCNTKGLANCPTKVDTPRECYEAAGNGTFNKYDCICQ